MGKISVEFFENGGICCPSCGVSGYGEDLRRQDRRHLRVREIEEKLDSSQAIHYTAEQAWGVINFWIDLPNEVQPLYVNKKDRLQYLCHKFSIPEKQMHSFLKGEMGIKQKTLRAVISWCKNNKDFILPDTSKHLVDLLFNKGKTHVTNNR